MQIPLGTVLGDYMEEIFTHLEYIGYPKYVSHFNPDDVAKSIVGASLDFKVNGISPRMAAICIFGLTMEHQILNTKEIKH